MDKLALTGSIIGLASVFPGWLTLKPNRLAAGTSLGLWDSFGPGGGAAVVVLWCLCLTVSLGKITKLRSILLGVSANLLIILVFAFAGEGARRLLGGELPSYRVSLSSGVWTSMLAVLVIIFASRSRLRDSFGWLNLVSWAGIAALIALLFTGWLDGISVLQEFLSQKARFIQELQKHLYLFGGSIAAGIIIGIPLGIWASRGRRVERPVFLFANITQTIPSLALFGLLIAPLSALSHVFPVLRQIGISGIGTAPAIIALILYSLLPIIQNTYTGLHQLDPALTDAGRGMGMDRFLIFRRIELPLAAPLIVEGIRTAAVQTVGNTAVAALIGAGGLGQLIFQGLGQAAPDLVVLGSLPIIILALIVDSGMRAAGKAAAPAGVRGAGK